MSKLQGTTQNGGLNDFTLISHFTSGYRAREDDTILPPGIMVRGSKNVLTNTAQRIGNRKGYTLDGQASGVLAPILTWFDWVRNVGDTRHVRAGNLTDPGTGLLQNRYVATVGDYYNGLTFAEGEVYWIDILTGLDSVSFNYTDYWDFAELQALMLFVNGQSLIYDWSGAVTTIASTTANTITKTGVQSWAEIGSYTSGTRKFTINGTEYTYTGGETTTTLTGVSPSPVVEPVQSVAFQTVRSTTNADITGLPPAFENDLISVVNNQVYIGSLIDRSAYVSKQNSFTDFSYSSPRVVGEGALLTLDAAPRAFQPMENQSQNGNQLWISAGQDLEYLTIFILSADLMSETLTVNRQKTTKLQGAQSQKWTTKIKNNVAYLSFEPIINTFGPVADVFQNLQVTDISYPIVDDLNSYDTTDGSIAYDKMYAYMCFPKESTVRIYNMTDPKNVYWEAPQIIPITGVSYIDGELYGHSYQTSQTFKLFTGYNDNGAPYDSVIKFSFNNYGTRSSSKAYNQYFTEGYISPNTTLNLGVQYEIDGCAKFQSFPIQGTSDFVCSIVNDAPLGKTSLGFKGLGTSSTTSSASDLPPKFRWIRTFPLDYFYEDQISYFSSGVDQNWELLSCGPQLSPAKDLNNAISE